MSIAQKLTAERRGRLAAERMLELKQAELLAANRKLGQYTQQLTEEIVETRAEVESIRGENQRVKSDLNAAREKIAVTERRLWHSIQTISDGFAFFDANNQMIMANDAYMRVFDGVHLVKPGVHYVTILQVMTEEGIVNTGDMTPQSWRRMMTARFEQPRPDPITLQLWNGSHFRLTDQRGPEGDVVSVAHDITALIEYERQLEEARKVAESANRAKSAFLANMSHEIRTPMNGVVGMADVLSETPLSEEQRQFVDTIRNSGEALLVIINDVLDFSKIEAGKIDLHAEPFDLHQAIGEVLTLLKPAASEKGLELVLDYDLFLPTHLIGDAGRIRQVMTNLVGNAVKFTSAGHVLVRVTGVPGDADQQTIVHVTVEDTGIGIPAHLVHHIFGEFNQVDDARSRQFEGTGLGLTITRRLVELMGGDIWVTSEEGVGACFGFRLPLHPDPSAGHDSPKLPDHIRNVLIIDPDERDRSILTHHFNQLGVAVQALPELSSYRPAVTPPDLFCCSVQSAPPYLDEIMRDLEQIRPGAPILLFSDMDAPLPIPDHLKSQSTVLAKPIRRRLITSKLLTLLEAQPNATDQTPRRMRVLAAEDNKTNQLVFGKMLRELDIDLRFANDGEEAVELWQALQPDIVFMDISMPKMDGKAATQNIRKLEGQKTTPIIALTAHALATDQADILEAGLTACLTKPLRKDAILDQIKDAHQPHFAPLFPDQEEG